MADPAAKKGAHVKRTYDRIPAGKNVYELALERARNVFEQFEHVVVAFSGGKDSTATLHVMLDAAHRWFPERLPITAVHYDEEAVPIQTEEYVRRVGQRDDVDLQWWCLPIKSGNACSRQSPNWWPWDPDCPEKWVRPLPPEALTHKDLPHFPTWPASARLSHYELNGLITPAGHGRTAWCLGIRADESMSRLRAVTGKKHENYLIPFTGSETTDSRAKVGTVFNPGHITKAYPIYDWTQDDVWSAPDLMGWDYNAAYDVMEMAGLPRIHQRCSPAFANEPLQKLWTYAHCFPEVWDGMTTRVPGAAAAARYALTELYAYRTRPEKPDGITWGEFIRAYVKKHPPKARAYTAKQMAYWIRFHYSMTSDPILPMAPHPRSGLSWDFLLMLAMRADPKDRKQPANRVKTGDVAQARMHATYDRERAKLEADGRLAELVP